MGKITENSNSIFNVKNIAIFILTVCLSGAGSSILIDGSPSADSLKTGIKTIIKETMSTEIEGLKQRVEELESKVKLNTDFRVDEYIKLILKNAKKIANEEYDDIKGSDIDICISYFGKIPSERKTEDVQAAIDIIVDYNATH